MRKAVAAALSLALPTLFAAGCDDGGQNTTATKAQPPSVVVTAVMRKDVTPGRSFVGRVEAIDSVELSARVEGFLEQRAFIEGDDVKKGDLLFVIEQAPYQAEVQSMQAGLLSAQATEKNAALNLERYQKLVKNNNISQAKVDEAEATEISAKAGVEEAKAALKEANLNLGYTTIYAPIDGRIGMATYSVGNLVNSSSDALAEIVSLDPIYVQFSVSDRDLLEARRQGMGDRSALMTPYLVLGDGTRYTYDGSLVFIDNKVSVQTDTVVVRGQFANPDGLLLPDQFVTVRVERTEPVAKLVVPQAAILEDQTGRYVLAVDKDDKAQVRRVTLGDQDGTDWIVDEGLTEGEQIIVEGLQKVRPGVTVKPMSGDIAPKAQPAQG